MVKLKEAQQSLEKLESELEKLNEPEFSVTAHQAHLIFQLEKIFEEIGATRDTKIVLQDQAIRIQIIENGRMFYVPIQTHSSFVQVIDNVAHHL